MPASLEDDDDAPKKPTRAKIIRTVIAVTVALACAGAFAWVRWGMKKADKPARQQKVAL